MIRRATLAAALALGALVTSLVADAQQAGKIYRLGFLANVPPTTRRWRETGTA
jgi:ABC-type sugar transport system substrate-binding protein